MRERWSGSGGCTVWPHMLSTLTVNEASALLFDAARALWGGESVVWCSDQRAYCVEVTPTVQQRIRDVAAVASPALVHADTEPVSVVGKRRGCVEDVQDVLLRFVWPRRDARVSGERRAGCSASAWREGERPE